MRSAVGLGVASVVRVLGLVQLEKSDAPSRAFTRVSAFFTSAPVLAIDRCGAAALRRPT
jgi:hypothetical protein